MSVCAHICISWVPPGEQISLVKFAPVQHHCGPPLSEMPQQMQLPGGLARARSARDQELAETAGALDICACHNLVIAIQMQGMRLTKT